MSSVLSVGIHNVFFCELLFSVRAGRVKPSDTVTGWQSMSRDAEITADEGRSPLALLENGLFKQRPASFSNADLTTGLANFGPFFTAANIFLTRQ